MPSLSILSSQQHNKLLCETCFIDSHIKQPAFVPTSLLDTMGHRTSRGPNYFKIQTPPRHAVCINS